MLLKRRRWTPHGTAVTGYTYLAPAILVVILVSAYPIALTVSYAFRETSFFEVGPFIGLDNFKGIVALPAFAKVLAATAKYVLGSLVLTFVIAIPLAVVLARRDRFTGFMRIVVLLPWVSSQTVSALLWSWLLTPNIGPVDEAIRGIFGSAPQFLADPAWATVSVVVANVWMGYPFATVLLLAAVTTIPEELHEAIAIDGGGWFNRFAHVTFPGIRNTLAIALIMQTILYFNMVTLIYTMTGGGPLTSTETLAVQIFHQAFDYNRLGFAAAYAVLALLLNFMFAATYLRSLSSDDSV